MIEHMCVLSTGHITQEVAQDIDNPSSIEAQEWREALIVYPHGEYGWLIYIPDEGLDAELPPSLEACIALARASRCQWLLLDRDASQVTNIPTYEW
jgi:hypothetical protein